MICSKCNHKLPDDSEFCQYCGCKVENKPAVSVVEPYEQPKSNFVNQEDALSSILKMHAKTTVDTMHANEQAQPDNENDADFGLVPEKPIFTHALKSVDGQRAYLDRLRTLDGQKLRYERQCSMSVESINGMIDVYETFLPSGEPYKTIYINMYGAKTSTKAPAGFVFRSVSQPRLAPTVAAPVNPASVKTKYCSKCGSAINSRTKVCTGCGKQYFKGFRFTKSSVAIIVLSFALAASLFVLVHMISEVNTLNNRVDKQDVQIKELERENRELHYDKYSLETELTKKNDQVWFFENRAEIVGGYDSDVYHKWGCSRLDLSEVFWIFNTEYAQWKGYRECPYCH